MKPIDLRILGVVKGGAFDIKTWSGSSKHLFGCLRSAGYLYDTISSRTTNGFDRMYKLLNFSPWISNWRFKYHIDVRRYELMTSNVLKELALRQKNDYNTILQIGAWYNLSKRPNKLTISYHDGNLATLLNSPWRYPHISRARIKRALAYEHNVYHSVDLIFPMSRWLADSFIRDFGVPAVKLESVGAGVNMPIVAPAHERSYTQRRILFVGREFERKGGRDLLEAFKLVRLEIPDATMAIVGPDVSISQKGVVNLGFISKQDESGIEALRGEYMAASVFVLPSLYEPFGISFVEAMAHRLPCVGTRTCAIPEIVDHNVTGLLVEPGDISGLANGLIGLLRSPETCRRMGDLGFRKYESHYRWEVVAQKIAERTSDLLSSIER